MIIVITTVIVLTLVVVIHDSNHDSNSNYISSPSTNDHANTPDTDSLCVYTITLNDII